MQMLSIDGFRAAAKDADVTPEAMVVSSTPGEASPTEGRRIKFVFSDGSVDRAGDTINPSGWDLDAYRKNPVVLFGHDSSTMDNVIGRTISVNTVGDKLVGEVEFAEASVNPRADMAFRMVKAGLLNAVSVGFMPIDFKFSTDKGRLGGIDFNRQSLLELSIVPVPANSNALVTARGMGIDMAPMTEWAEQLVRDSGKVPVPKGFLEAQFRAAKTPKSLRNKYLSPKAHVKADGSNWRCGAARDLPVADTGASWDGPAAAARMFAAAGFDGDSPNAATARRGFLIYDSANPTLKGSYKLPFADISGGSLKAIPSGIRAAASRLPQTDAPQGVLDSARGVLDHYEGKAGIGSSDGKETGRGMDDVAALAWLIDRLAEIEDSVESEESYEGDGSLMSNRLQAAVGTLGQILVDMTAEEVAELVADKEDDDEEAPALGPMMMAARTKGQRTLVKLAALAQGKAGRVLNAANQTLLEQAKACHKKAMDCMSQAHDMMNGAMAQHQKALELHQEAASCVGSVLGNQDMEPDGIDPEPGDLHDPVVPQKTEDAEVVKEPPEDAALEAEKERQRRIRKARALALAAETV